ncbi:type III-B CRISPR module-associated protein Cmr5 [Paenibacillus sonchi]|uniref:type III-B CRISPR module-associated protein Cmr5 n=1 Tax=Paenibacillus sonchi TaxID=373687 RepID=UPI001E434B70|nr:type III-B CRISPR module-associated protein Cmr5 [Paenibacillus sonchi]MCE3199215.1 type III-B CRISPR module-associated protein Cmr5 [Paenibacillus sonchi]
MKSAAHTYAEKAMQSIRSVEADPDCNNKDYGRLCLLFPSMVQVNGLRLTVAFFQSKGKSQKTLHQRYLQDLAATVDSTTWETGLRTNDMMDYRDLTRHVLQAAVWFKRYAEAILKVEAADGLDS